MGTMTTPSPKRLIDERGGYVAVANALGWPKTTVHTWWRLEKIPEYRRPLVESLPVQPKPKKPRKPKRAA